MTEPTFQPGRHSLSGRQSGMFLAACLALMIIGLVIPLSGLFTHVSADYGEGFNAYWAAAAMKGTHSLYSPTHVMVANNYPPLSFYLIGEFGKIIGDNIFAGRIVALAAMVATATLTGRVVTLLGAPRHWGWITGLLLMACAEHLFGHFIAIDNPQWLGQAIMLGGTIPLVRRLEGPGPIACLASAAAMIMAVLVKHNLFAFPLASALWLAIYHRDALVRWSLCIIILAALAVAGLYAAYGSAIFVEIIGFERTVDWQNFRSGLAKTLCFTPMLLVAAAVTWRSTHDPRWILFAIAGLLGLVLGIVQRLGAGIYINAHYEALVGLVIVTGHAFGNANVSWREPFGAKWWQSALLMTVLIPIIIPLPKHIRDWHDELKTQELVQSEWARTITDVHNAHDLVICEIPAVCYWSNKPFIVDFFAFGQKYRKIRQPLQLYNWIASRQVNIIIIEKTDIASGREARLPAPFPSLIDRQYRSVRTISLGNIQEMVPRFRS